MAASTPPALDDPAFWHLYAEAGRLVQADRRHWVGDPDHVRVPAAELAAPAYQRERAALIDPARAATQRAPGHARGPGPIARTTSSSVAAETSQIVVADAQGNVVTCHHHHQPELRRAPARADGYVLNNALTNFGPAPARGQVIANQMAPGKRPITSMAPLIVFDAAGPGAAGRRIGRRRPDRRLHHPQPDRDAVAGPQPDAQALAGGHVTTALAPRIQLEAGTARAALAGGACANADTTWWSNPPSAAPASCAGWTAAGSALPTRAGMGWRWGSKLGQ